MRCDARAENANDGAGDDSDDVDKAGENVDKSGAVAGGGDAEPDKSGGVRPSVSAGTSGDAEELGSGYEGSGTVSSLSF